MNQDGGLVSGPSGCLCVADDGDVVHRVSADLRRSTTLDQSRRRRGWEDWRGRRRTVADLPPVRRHLQLYRQLVVNGRCVKDGVQPDATRATHACNAVSKSGFLARDVIYATMSVSVCLSVCDGSALAHYS